MLRFDIITIFPEAVTPYVKTSILKRAQDKRLVKIAVHDLRQWAADKHRTVDDAPYGGGPGMVMKAEPIYRAVNVLTARNPKPETRNSKQTTNPKSKKRTRVILFSASGKPFTQRVAEQYAKKYDRLILICGRYEGVDHRVAKHIANEELSVGPYVLTGGELPALTVVDAVVRLVPGVIRPESLYEESFALSSAVKAIDAVKGRKVTGRLQPLRPLQPSYSHFSAAVGEYPHYTRPEVFYPNAKNKKIAWRVPKVLLSGDHARIAEWRRRHMRRAALAPR